MCWYGIKRQKNVLCLIVVGLLDLRAFGQSDVTSAERRGVFDDLWLSRFLQSGEEEVNMGDVWFRVSLFLGVSSLLVSSAFFWSAPLSRNLSFISFFSSDWIKLGFLCFLPRRSRIGRKIIFNCFYFLTNFIAISLCADPMCRNLLFPFWRKSQHR